MLVNSESGCIRKSENRDSVLSNQFFRQDPLFFQPGYYFGYNGTIYLLGKWIRMLNIP